MRNANPVELVAVSCMSGHKYYVLPVDVADDKRGVRCYRKNGQAALTRWRSHEKRE
jgi:hypothetical protein